MLPRQVSKIHNRGIPYNFTKKTKIICPVRKTNIIQKLIIFTIVYFQFNPITNDPRFNWLGPGLGHSRDIYKL